MHDSPQADRFIMIGGGIAALAAPFHQIRVAYVTVKDEALTFNIEANAASKYRLFSGYQSQIGRSATDGR